MRRGLERSGVICAYGHYDEPTARTPDFAVIWGAPSKQPHVCRESPRVLVMERGHLPDRMQYASLGWDGLARRGRYPTAADGGARWRERWGHLMQPWTAHAGYALLIGQVPGDAAVRALDLDLWVKQQTAMLRHAGWQVRFRPHPMVRPSRSLAEDLAGAALCVTYNSTTGVESVLAGVPTVTLDEGAMAWPVAGHDLHQVVRPHRDAWAHDLAFTSWSLDEIAAGDPWQHLAPIMEEAACPTS
jgi:hypothetical protein